MIWKIVSFNNFDLESDEYDSFFDDADKPMMQPTVRTSGLARAGSAPSEGIHFLDVNYFVVTVQLKGAAKQALYEALVQNVRTVDRNLYKLLAEDESGVQWYVMARPINHVRMAAINKVTFEVFDAIWRAEMAETDTWNITASGQTQDIVVGGNQDTWPSFTITPTTTPSGYYEYRQYITNYNPIARAQTDGIDLTNGGWNTAALIAAGKMQITGADVRVIDNGNEIPFWVGGGGINSATAKIFVRVAWQAGKLLKLRTAVANTGTPAYLEFEKTTEMRTLLKGMPRQGMVRVNNEEFSYLGVNVVNCRVTVVDRSIRGTTAGSHAIGDIAYWVEHDLQIVYGNPSASAPTYSDVFKPVFDLASSTNTSRVYTEFADSANKRAGRWMRLTYNDGTGNASRVYSGNQGAEAEADPATDMGMEINNYRQAGRWKPDTANLGWLLAHPAEITTVSASGEKYKKATNTTWPDVASLESSLDNRKWVQEWNESAPGSAATWTGWTHNGEAIPSGSRFVRFHFYGSVNAVANNTARFEVNTVTVVLNSSNVIQVGMMGEETNYQFSIRITNQATGEWMEIEYPVSEDKSLKIDTENYEVSYRGKNAIAAITLDAVRTEWLRFISGTNTLEYTADPTGDVTIVTTWRKRKL